MLKKSLAILFTALGVLLFSNSASAKVNSLLVQDSTGAYLEYSYDALIQDYTNNLIGQASPLYDEYTKNAGGLKAFKDSVKGYVNADDVISDYAQKLSLGKGSEFNIDNFTEQASEPMIINPTGTIKQRVLNGTTVVDGTSTDVSSDFDVISVD